MREMVHPPGRATQKVVQLSELALLDDGELQDGALLRLDANGDAWAAWADARSHPPLPDRARRGHADGTRRTLATAHALLLGCSTRGCTALVSWQPARRCAHAAGRTTFGPGDGCSGRLCGASFRPSKFGRRQLKAAAGLEAGERWLVAWPPSSDARELVLLPRADVIGALRARHPRDSGD